MWGPPPPTRSRPMWPSAAPHQSSTAAAHGSADMPPDSAYKFSPDPAASSIQVWCAPQVAFTTGGAGVAALRQASCCRNGNPTTNPWAGRRPLIPECAKLQLSAQACSNDSSSMAQHAASRELPRPAAAHSCLLACALHLCTGGQCAAPGQLGSALMQQALGVVHSQHAGSRVGAAAIAAASGRGSNRHQQH